MEIGCRSQLARSNPYVIQWDRPGNRELSIAMSGVNSKSLSLGAHSTFRHSSHL